MSAYCTLFDSGYLDRGCLLIESLQKVSPEATLYVLAFDEKCFDALKDIAYSNVSLISMKEFESSRLLSMKENRSHRSYCWSCTPFLIKYVLEELKEEICTYIDADMMFYSNPEILVKDVIDAKADVGIVEHRFGKGKIQEKQYQIAGKYCVEFNTFQNNDNGLRILNWWANQCEECCTDDISKSKDGFFGDQMYLNDWTTRFSNVYVMQNQGGGMAPWNIYRYRHQNIDQDNNIIDFTDTQSHGNYRLVFYHFHDVKLYSDKKANINVYGRYGKSEHPDDVLIRSIYSSYIGSLFAKRIFLYEKYNIIWPKTETSSADLKEHFPNLFYKLRHFNSYWNFKKNIL